MRKLPTSRAHEKPRGEPYRDGNRVSDMITRLRARFSNDELVFEVLDLNEITREVLALMLTDLQRYDIDLQCEFAEDLSTVAGDRIQLQQVISNLIRNASDAMEDVHDRSRQLLIRASHDTGDGGLSALRIPVSASSPKHEQDARRVLHDQAGRHGPRSLDQPFHHRAPSREALG